MRSVTSLALLTLTLTLACSREEPSPSKGGRPEAKPAALPAAATTPPPTAAVPPKAVETAAPAVPPTPGTLRFVVVNAAELLKSEQGQIKQIQAHLEKAGNKVDAAPSTAEEQAYLKTVVAAPDASPALPSSWARFETVILLQIEPNWVVAQRMSGGRSQLFVLHPPQTVPVFSTIYAETGKQPTGTPLDGARFGIWLKNHLVFRKGPAK